MRHETEVLVIWIDAISINQTDIEERNREVARMGDIYSKCAQVNVWLGKLTEVDELLQDGKDGGRLQRRSEEEETASIQRARDFRHHLLTLDLVEKVTNTTLPAEVLHGLELIFRREWFTRVVS
jgi:hypothetical protein